jgi:STE24 endopeptidase
LNTYLILILCLYITKEAFEYLAEYLNLSHMIKSGTSVPPEFQGKADEAFMKRMQEYEGEKTRFSFISSLFGNIVTIAFIFGGILNNYNSWIASLNLPFLISGWTFFMLLSLVSELLSIPFSLYTTFRIENKYGFNTMTPGLWISDFMKSLVISLIILTLAIFAGLWLVQWSPFFWWFWVWGFFLLLSIMLMYLSPSVIEPLFNKFTPIEDESLRARIIQIAEKAGIHVSRILRVDASKRSRHTNAYFTGIGKTKRIVLYDTLLEGMNHDEIISVLAHEIGHWKKRHLLKTMALLQPFTLIAFYLAHRFVQSDFLLSLFRIEQDTLFAKAVILAFLAGIVTLPLKPLMNTLLRTHEREADRVSFALTGNAEGMVSAFVKLSKENLSNLYPHPLYVGLYYSHPPILERIRMIREMKRKELPSSSSNHTVEFE